MKTFIYQLKDETGKSLYGFMDAESMEEVKKETRKFNAYFIKAYPTESRNIFTRKVPLEVLLMFTQRLSSLIGAGVPILSSMRILWRQSDDKSIQLVISHIYRTLEEGRKISRALKDFPNIFPPVYCALVGVAEIAGSLSLVLEKICMYLSYQRETSLRIKKAALYPVIVVVFALIVLVGMFVFVVPTFQNVLLKLNTDLPFLTMLVMSISKVLKSWIFWLVLISLGITGFFILNYMRKKDTVAYKLDQYSYKLPVVGNIFYMTSLGRFVHALKLLVSAGLPIVKSFEVAKATVHNAYLIKGIDEVQTSIRQGQSLHESIQETRIFPSMFIEMVGIGESSGRMEDMLDTLAFHFDQEVEFKQSRVLTLMEPALIILVGVVVILTLLAVYMPIFSIWQGLLR